jgi:hypothetical protein
VSWTLEGFAVFWRNKYMSKNELAVSLEAAVAMSAFPARVQMISDIYGMWRADRVTVVVECDTKRDFKAMVSAAKALSNALRTAGYATSLKMKTAEGPLHMGYPLRWIASFSVAVA